MFIRVLLLVSSVLAWDCGISLTSLPYIFRTPKTEGRKFERGDELAPIRLTFTLYDFDLGSSGDNSYFQTEVLTSVSNFFQSVLRVYPLKNNLVLSGLEQCGEEVNVPEEHRVDGIENTDLIIYITTLDRPAEGFVAYAGACAIQDDGFNNVIAGRVVINVPEYLKSSFETKFTLLIHEITHLLGFSNSLYEFFRKPDGTPYAEGELIVTEVVRGATKSLIKSPTVLEQARHIFNCDTLEGVELENYANIGNTGSHWDMRVAYNDYMIAHVTNDPIFSSLTFALLKDTGWYEINWAYTQTPIFGYMQGCTFHTERCVDNGVANFDEFCTDTQQACDIFHLYKGFCNLVEHAEPVPEEFQYFEDPQLGGEDKYIDYCPIRDTYADGSCRNNGPLPTTTYEFYGETVCTNCRCLEGTLLQEGWVVNQAEPYHTGCYELTACYEDHAEIQVGNEQTGYFRVDCPFTGGSVTVPGYSGYLVCPSSNVLCGNIPCFNGCSGLGICVEGKCHCDSGYGGDDCSIKCDPSCESCTGISINACLSCTGANEEVKEDGSCGCIADADLIDGACVCDWGYTSVDNACVQCVTPSSDCFSGSSTSFLSFV